MKLSLSENKYCFPQSNACVLDIMRNRGKRCWIEKVMTGECRISNTEGEKKFSLMEFKTLFPLLCSNMWGITSSMKEGDLVEI